MEKQPTEEELNGARERARADAEARATPMRSPAASRKSSGEQPLPYAAEDAHPEYARVYEETLAQLRRRS